MLYGHMDTHIQFSVFDMFWPPFGASAADVGWGVGGGAPALSVLVAPFPLKCHASSVLRCSTVYLLPLLSTLLIDAICAVITPPVIKQHFSRALSGCQALRRHRVFFLLLFRSAAGNDSNLPKQKAWEGASCVGNILEEEDKLSHGKRPKKVKKCINSLSLSYCR